MAEASPRQRYTFDTIFSDDGRVVAMSPRDARQRTHIPREEVEVLAAEAFSKGLADAAAAAQLAESEALVAMARAIEDAMRNMDAIVHRLRGDSTIAALAFARKLAAGALARAPMPDVEHLVSTAMHALHNEPRLIIRVEPALAARLEARIPEIAEDAGYSGRVVIKPDPHQGHANCRIEWSDGGIERNLEAAAAEAEEAVARWLAASAADENGPANTVRT